jgi:hypothetical protein
MVKNIMKTAQEQANPEFLDDHKPARQYHGINTMGQSCDQQG